MDDFTCYLFLLGLVMTPLGIFLIGLIIEELGL